MLQKSNGVHQACAACKHQRKKCSENCVLAPFFPSDKVQEFQAVHKVFGVSNVSKMLKSLKTYEDREKAINTLVWEARWRQIDPVFGCYGLYKKLHDELNMLRSQQVVIPTLPDSMLYNKPGCTIGWSNHNNGTGGEINFNNTGNYIENNGTFTIEPIPFGYGQAQDNGAQGRDAVNCFNQQFYLPDQYSQLNVRMDKTM